MWILILTFFVCIFINIFWRMRTSKQTKKTIIISVLINYSFTFSIVITFLLCTAPINCIVTILIVISYCFLDSIKHLR
jgi:hypothetical protein